MGRRSSKHLVAHVKGSHLLHDRHKPVDPKSFLRALADDGWLIIYLTRQRVADQVLSELIALHAGWYHKMADHQLASTVSVDPAEFINRVKRRVEYHQQDRDILEGLPFLKFTYEDHLMLPECHQASVDIICRTLKIPSMPVATKLRRIATTDPRQRLENYNEIISALADCGMNWSTKIV
jgi:hypothetical protein